MLYAEQDAKLKPHLGRIEELETQLGIRDAAERAREGSFMPLGIDGERVDPEEYFADEYDDERRKTRKLYFSIENMDAKRELIEEARTVQELRRHFSQIAMQDAKGELAKVKARMRKLPWGSGAIIALLGIGLGYWLRGDTGAIGGAVFGFFMGYGYVQNSKGQLETDLEQAEQALKQAKRDEHIRALYPEMFSHEEARSGQENNDFTTEYALYPVRQFLEVNPD